MRLKLADIPELPAEEHAFDLLPVRRLTLSNGLTMSYREAGSGAPILLLHGLWTSAFTFRNLIEPLSPRFRLILPDLLDPRGKQLLDDGDYRPERLAELALLFLDGLDLKRVLLVGHAESGLAGMELALGHPERLTGLVAVGPSIRLSVLARLGGWWRARNDALRWARTAFGQPSRAALTTLDYADSTVVSRQELRLQALAWTTLPGATARARILAQTLTTAYRRGVVERIQAHVGSGGGFGVPVKLVFGGADRRAPPEHGQRLSRLIPGSELLIAERSSGAVQLERPQWVAEIIARTAGS